MVGMEPGFILSPSLGFNNISQERLRRFSIDVQESIGLPIVHLNLDSCSSYLNTVLPRQNLAFYQIYSEDPIKKFNKKMTIRIMEKKK